MNVSPQKEILKTYLILPLSSLRFQKLQEGLNPKTGNIYLFKFNNRNTRKKCEICPKLTIKTPGRHH